MKTAQGSTAKISEHFSGLGTVTPEMVEQRAREIALINGRPPNVFNSADFEEARLELTGKTVQHDDEDEGDPDRERISFDGPAGSVGHKVPVIKAADEQMMAEELVEEGVEEAEHDRMVEGSKTSTRQTG